MKENIELNIVLNYLKNRFTKLVKEFRENDFDNDHAKTPDNRLPNTEIAELSKVIVLQEEAIAKSIKDKYVEELVEDFITL